MCNDLDLLKNAPERSKQHELVLCMKLTRLSSAVPVAPLVGLWNAYEHPSNSEGLASAVSVWKSSWLDGYQNGSGRGKIVQVMLFQVVL